MMLYADTRQPVKFRKGQHVTGATASGHRFEGKVLNAEFFSIVLLTPRHWTPVTMIKTVDDEEIIFIEPGRKRR